MWWWWGCKGHSFRALKSVCANPEFSLCVGGCVLHVAHDWFSIALTVQYLCICIITYVRATTVPSQVFLYPITPPTQSKCCNVYDYFYFRISCSTFLLSLLILFFSVNKIFIIENFFSRLHQPRRLFCLHRFYSTFWNKNQIWYIRLNIDARYSTYFNPVCKMAGSQGTVNEY